MKVEQKVFYQIAKNRNYSVGDILHFRENDSGLYQAEVIETILMK